MPNSINMPQPADSIQRLDLAADYVRGDLADASSGAGAGNCYCTCFAAE